MTLLWLQTIFPPHSSPPTPPWYISRSDPFRYTETKILKSLASYQRYPADRADGEVRLRRKMSGGVNASSCDVAVSKCNIVWVWEGRGTVLELNEQSRAGGEIGGLERGR